MGPQYYLLCRDNNSDDHFYSEDNGDRDARSGEYGCAGTIAVDL